MSWIYCKCGQGLDRPTPRQVLSEMCYCPKCGLPVDHDVTVGEAVLDLFDSLAPSAPPTLRDQFAMSALQGILSSPVMGDSDLHESAEIWLKDITESAYEFADAMLEARK